MRHYDVVFLHPPRVFESSRFRLRKLISEKLGSKKEEIRPQYCQIPMGIFSLAATLDKEGYDVKIINLGLEQKTNLIFNLDRYIKSMNAKIFAIDLHWFVHTASALMVADVCKRNHPNSLVLLGGMTATWFHNQILKDYPSVDVIIRGEADLSMPHLVGAYITDKGLHNVDGITYRQNGQIKQTPIGKIAPDLDAIEPFRLDLLENYDKYLKSDIIDCGKETTKFFWIPVARSCRYDCAHCGGGRHSYSLLTGRNKMALRTPEKVAEDIRMLQEKGIERVHISHDPEIGGRKYYLDMFEAVKNRDLDLSAYVEIFRLPTRDFIEKFTKVFHDAAVAISPETFSEEVRQLIGRQFSNHAFFKSLDMLKEKGVKTQVWFTIGLPGEVLDLSWFETFKDFFEKISTRGAYVIPPLTYTIDPNCLLAIENEKYRIRLFLKTFEDYKKICSSDNPLDWIGHETETSSREKIATFTAYAYSYVTHFQSSF